MLSSLAIVVLSYGMPNPSDELIRGLLRGGSLTSSQILEVHNPRVTGERAEVGSDHRVVNLPVNVGYAGGMNVALDDPVVAAAEYVLLLTHDVRISPDAVAALLETMRADPDLIAVGPVLTHEGRVWSAGQARQKSWEYRHIQQTPGGGPPVSVDSLDGSALLLRQGAVASARFETSLFMYFEETELLLRLRRKLSGRIAVVPAAIAESEPGQTRRPKANAFLMARNGLTIASMYGGSRAVLRYLRHLLRQSIAELAWPAPGDARHGIAGRRTAAGIVAARFAGIGAFLAGRTGRPPERFADGDLAALGATRESAG